MFYLKGKTCISRGDYPKNRYRADKSTKFGTGVPWVTLKHPRRGAQKNLKQEVNY